MTSAPDENLLQRVRVHALGCLTVEQHQTTNLSLSLHVFEEGEPIGPAFQNIAATRASLVVFADDDPRANFGHSCRYLLYEASSGRFDRAVPVRFPPVASAIPAKTLCAFHEPVRSAPEAVRFHVYPPVWRCPIVIPDGTRYAILYSGMPNARHLNDMEFLYRTLVDVCAFNPAHIHVLSYDGTPQTPDGAPPRWPGDNSQYRIKVTGPGTRAAFEAAVDGLKWKLNARDTLLVHCTGHGDCDDAAGNSTGNSFLCTYPHWDRHYDCDFSAKLAQLPKIRRLNVLLGQCSSGGFNSSILAGSSAGETSVASAAGQSQSSYASGDGNWNPFARDWIAAQAGHDPYGGALAFNADTDADGKVESRELYAYANAVKLPLDSPNFGERSAALDEIALGQKYRLWWWWCVILYETLDKYRIKLPPKEYNDYLHRLRPEFTKLTAETVKPSNAIRREIKAKVESLVSSAFDAK